jgi:two-component system LytT family response regulator
MGLGIKGLEDRLGPGRFLRVHKSYVIALDKIESIQKTQLIVGQQEIPIGYGYREILQDYLEFRSLKT